MIDFKKIRIPRLSNLPDLPEPPEPLKEIKEGAKKIRNKIREARKELRDFVNIFKESD